MNEPNPDPIFPHTTPASHPPPPLPRTDGPREAPVAGAPSPVDPMERTFAPLAGITPLGLAEALLKRPGGVVYETDRGDVAKTALALGALLLVCVAAYGWIIGSFSGGKQAWMAPLKLLAIVPFSALICFPSLYIFSSLGGARQSIAQTGALLLGFLSLAGILMIGFGPIAWVFAQSTHALPFMGLMHTVFWLAAFLFGMRFLSAAYRFLNGRRSPFLGAWGLILLVVIFQVATLLRPLIGEYDGPALHGKKAFIMHWAECLK